MKYTKGPWFVSDILDNDQLGIVTGDNGIIVGSNNCMNATNAKLIAAAPELLESLKDAVNRLESCAKAGGTVEPFLSIALKPFRDVIAKAEGREVSHER